MSSVVRLRVEDLDADTFAHHVLDGLLYDLHQPKFRVKFITSGIVAGLCARSGMRMLPAVLTAVAAGVAAAWLYETAEEIKGKLGGGDAAGEV